MNNNPNFRHKTLADMRFRSNEIVQKLFNNRKHILLFILLSFICLLPNTYFMLCGSPLSQSLTKKIGFYAISVSFFLTPFLFLRIRSAFLFNGLFVLFAPLEIAHIYLNKQPIGSGFIFILLQTNLQEILEYIISYKLLVIFTLIIYFIYFVVVIKYVPKTHLLTRKERYYALFIFISLIIGLYTYCFFLSTQLQSKSIKETLASSKQAFEKKFSLIYPVDLFLAINSAFESQSDMNQLSENLKDFKFHAQQTSLINQKEVFVLVIGESARYSNFSINNYYRKTSPELSRVKDLFSFRNVYSEANLTGHSLPILLTRSSAKNFNIWKKEKTVVDAFKEAGFSTYWIANQSNGDSFIKRIAAQTNGNFFITKDYDAVENYDADLWSFLDKVLDKNEKKQFIVIHTLGSHFRYNYRYPPSFRRFKPDFIGAFDYDLVNKNNRQQHINSYDNSILYTDYFLANTIQKINKKNAVSYFFYISDHGENLFENNQLFHGSVNATRFEAHIPLFVWTSQKYKQKFPEKIASLKSNINKQITSEVAFYSLLDLADVHFKGNNPTKSIASCNLKNDSIRYMLNANLDIVPFKN